LLTVANLHNQVFKKKLYQFSEKSAINASGLYFFSAYKSRTNKSKKPVLQKKNRYKQGCTQDAA
jgi:hypothetical protein